MTDIDPVPDVSNASNNEEARDEEASLGRPVTNSSFEIVASLFVSNFDNIVLMYCELEEPMLPIEVMIMVLHAFKC